MGNKTTISPPITTPILFLVFNRPDTTERVFKVIRQVKPKQLFVASDGPRQEKEGDEEKIKQVRNIVTQIDWDCEVKTLFRKKNLGCKIAVSSAIDWFFENVEEGIILKDDSYSLLIEIDNNKTHDFEILYTKKIKVYCYFIISELIHIDMLCKEL